LDIKLENIVFDKNFEPIIIDFGYSMELEELDGKILPFKGSRGSKLYESPEMLENKEYNGIQSDIFSLGVILFNIVSGSYGFKSSSTDDKYYKFIVNNKDEYKDYWKLVEQTVNMKFSDNFKKLYVKMVAYNPSDRIKNIDEILNDPWFQEINEEQDKDKLELEYKENISKICENIKIEENKELIVSDEIIKEGYNTRCDDDDQKRAFTNGKIKAKKIPNDMILVNHFIKIKGNIPELDFMNDLYDEIIENLNGFCKESKESLEFEVTFEETEERGICKMDIELFKYEEGRYLLEFLRTRGEIQDYYHYFSEIKELLKKNEE
jgi:serine/threonine protein kinase